MEMDAGMKYVYKSVFAGWYTFLTRGEVMRIFFILLWFMVMGNFFLFTICCRYAAKILANFVS